MDVALELDLRAIDFGSIREGLQTQTQASMEESEMMTATQTIRALHAANQLNQRTIATLEKRITELEEWIKREGFIHDECTFGILNRVCDGCRCGREKKK